MPAIRRKVRHKAKARIGAFSMVAIVSLKEPSRDPGKAHPPEKADHVAFRRAALNR
jgi:hypothetical protein